MKRIACVLVVSLSLTAANGQRPDADSLERLPQIVKRFVRSLEGAKFAGTRRAEVLDGARRVTIVEHVLRDGAKMKISYPDNSPRAGQIVVHNARMQRTFYPGLKHILQVESPLGQDLKIRALITRGIEFKVTGHEDIAGRTCAKVNLTNPRGRVIQTLWIDQQTGVPLKRTVFNAVGQEQGSFEFTSIDFSPRIAPGDFEINAPDAKVVTPYDMSNDQGRRLDLHPKFLPKGNFFLQSSEVVRGENGNYIHQTYDSEWGIVSFFQAKGVENSKTSPVDVGRVWKANGNSYALVGALPQPMLKRLAKLLGEPPD